VEGRRGVGKKLGEVKEREGGRERGKSGRVVEGRGGEVGENVSNRETLRERKRGLVELLEKEREKHLRWK